jgi:CheY-like chemotaxis protein
MLNEKGCCNSARNPAARGSIAVLYATGAGQTSPPGVDGNIPPTGRMADYPVPELPVRVTVGGQTAEILYAGAAPHAVSGLLQVNFRVPANAPTGDAVPLVLTVGDGRSPDGVTMAVRSAVQRVLVVDDAPAARNWFSKVLAGAGYEVSLARNGREATTQAGEHSIDLVICSLTIPEAERTEIMHEMLASRPQLKIVATAGALGPRTLRAADLLGAQAVLTKPMSSRVVLQRVRELLRPRTVPYVVD